MKKQIATAIHKLKVVVHTIVPPVGSREAKNALSTSQSEIFHGHMEGERAESDGERSDRSEQREVDVSFLPGWASKVLIASILGAGLSPTRIACGTFIMIPDCRLDSSRQFGCPSKLPSYYAAATDSKIYFATVSAANALCIESSR